jgi:biopolymer transport protein ExbD
MRRRPAGRGRRSRAFLASSPGRLRMTSLMDILTVLLLFLLKSFVVDAESVTPVPGVDLPRSTSEETPQESLDIVILGNGILLGGELVCSAEELARGDLYLESLGQGLEAMRKRSEHIASLKKQGQRQTRVTVQGDRALEFQLLERVMYTLSESGYPNISLAVIRES